ncbi:MAG: hypothetical protein QOH67_1966 [Hyphomicrobiales bacterium]|jgi:hypothetical protein|nr:hypothetical protein [Hyphomicrobiales bacterium]
MRIVGASGPTINASVSRRKDGADAPDASETDSRALIAIEAPAVSEPTPRVTRHPSAGFLAQLIATQMQAPQTRARRRAEPGEAMAVYRSMTKPVSQRRSFGKRA